MIDKKISCQMKVAEYREKIMAYLLAACRFHHTHRQNSHWQHCLEADTILYYTCTKKFTVLQHVYHHLKYCSHLHKYI